MKKNGDYIVWRGTHLKLLKSHHEWVVWCGQKAIVTGKTKAVALDNLREYLREVADGKKVLGG